MRSNSLPDVGHRRTIIDIDKNRQDEKMKRKATKFMALAISTVLVISLTACGDGNGEEVEDAVTPVEAQPMLSELELEILNLETKYNKG